jgi:outer membrane lipoprotein-sorting protein
MKARAGLLGLALTLCALHVGKAQDPKPEDVLKRVAAVYREANAYQDSVTTKMQIKVMGMDIAFDVVGSLAMVKPNRVKVSLKVNPPMIPGVPSESQELSITSDGKKMWTYSATQKQYAMQDAPKSLEEALSGVTGRGGGMMRGGMGGLSSLSIVHALLFSAETQKTFTQDVKNLKLVGSEDVGGSPTYVLTWDVSPPETDKGESPIPLPADLKNLNMPIKAWVSKESFVVQQMSLDLSPMMKAIFSVFGEMGAQFGGEKADKQQMEQLKAMFKDMQFVMTETHKDVKINGSIPDETFTFQPPADAKKVDKLDVNPFDGNFSFPGMGGERSVEPPSPLLGKPAPDFTLKDRLGKPVKLSQLRGKPVMLNFWAEF